MKKSILSISLSLPASLASTNTTAPRPSRFMDYRIALQELGIQQLKLSSATEPITADKDPYKISQVHDYKSISFLRQNPNVKAASTEVIKQFALAYPELLKVSKITYLTLTSLLLPNPRSSLPFHPAFCPLSPPPPFPYLGKE